MSTPELRVEHLSFSFEDGPKKLFSDLNFVVGKDTAVVGIVGPNGVGKSVLTKILVGLLKPHTGQVYVDGTRVDKIPTSQRSHLISLTFQHTSHMFFKETVKDEVLFTLNTARKNNSDRSVQELLEKYSLDSKTMTSPSQLSGGERRKLTHLLLSLLAPKVLLLDEPTVGLDRKGRGLLRQMIEVAAAEGRKVVLVTHDIAFLTEVCDKSLFLERRNDTTEIAFEGTIEDYYSLKATDRIEKPFIPIEIQLFYQWKERGLVGPTTTLQEFLAPRRSLT